MQLYFESTQDFDPLENAYQQQEIQFSIEVQKQSDSLGIKQKRILVITNESINLLRRNRGSEQLILKRVLQYRDIKGISKSLSNEKEFLVHGQSTHDLHLISDERGKILDMIKKNYLKAQINNLAIYGIDSSEFKQYLTTRSEIEQGNQKDLPGQEVRLLFEDTPIPRKTMFQEIKKVEEKQMKRQEEKGVLVYQRENLPNQNPKLSDFEIINMIGKGSVSNVYLVKNKTEGQPYAMKSLRKDTVIEKELLQSAKLEKNLLLKSNSLFFVKIYYVFITDTHILYIMDFIKGGDLKKLIQDSGAFTEDMVKFYTCIISMTLGYLHAHDIIYRNLILDNIMLQDDGYICLVDFLFSKQLNQKDITFSVKGAPQYLAPEVLGKKGHSHSVDWWALGIIIYEMLVGKPPFYEEDEQKMYKNIMSKKVTFPENAQISKNCKDFIIQLLHKDPHKRLGAKMGFQEVMSHPFVSGVNLGKLKSKEIPPPYRRKPTSDPFDVSNFHDEVKMTRTTEETVRWSFYDSQKDEFSHQNDPFKDF